jgi:hypothetical protein
MDGTMTKRRFCYFSKSFGRGIYSYSRGTPFQKFNSEFKTIDYF